MRPFKVMFFVLLFLYLHPLGKAEAYRDKCFAVHGRYRVYSGDGVTAIWIVGTHRVLRVNHDKDLWKLTGHYVGTNTIFGDFVVCPRAPDVPGAMRIVDIKSWRNLRIVHTNSFTR